jgi:protein farnesyltransferase subunit beta
LCILGMADVIDLDGLLNWVCHRQMSLEGGFQGRTNKLVDSSRSSERKVRRSR